MEGLFADLPEVETGRLKLIQASLDRTADLFAFAGSREATRFMSWETNTSLEQTVRAIHYMMAAYEADQPAPWLILHKEADRVIGMAGFNWYHPTHRRAEISYALAPAWWGQGLATEAVRALIRFGFGRLDLNRIEALVHPENTSSRRVLDKVGMVEEGLLQEALFLKGVPTDHLLYRVLKREWRQ